MPYLPPSGNEVAFNFENASNYPVAPSGNEVGFDFSTDETIVNAYLDSGLRSVLGNLNEVSVGFDSTLTGLIGINSNTLNASTDFHIIDYSFSTVYSSFVMSSYCVMDSKAMAFSMTSSSSLSAYADFYYINLGTACVSSFSFNGQLIKDIYISVNMTGDSGDTELGISEKVIPVEGYFFQTSVFSCGGMLEFYDGKLDYFTSYLFNTAHLTEVQHRVDFESKNLLSAGYDMVQTELRSSMTGSDFDCRGYLTYYVHDFSLNVGLKHTMWQEHTLSAYFTRMEVTTKLNFYFGLDEHVKDLVGGSQVWGYPNTMLLSNSASFSPILDRPPTFTTSLTSNDLMLIKSNWSYTPQAIDDYDNTNLVIQVHQKPSFMTWENGVLSGNPSYADIGTYPIVISATDSIGNATVQSSTLNVVGPFRSYDLTENTKDFLKNSMNKFLIVEFEGVRYSSDHTTIPFRFASLPFISSPDDRYPNLPIANRIYDIPAFSRGMRPDLSGAETSWGEITLINKKDKYSSLLDSSDTLEGIVLDHSTRFRKLVIKAGEATLLYNGSYNFTPYDDLVTVFTGCIGDRGVTIQDRNKLSIPIRSNVSLLTVKLSKNRYPKDDTENADKGIPESWGGTPEAPIFNIKPVLIDAANNIYQYHNGAAGGVIAVREGGHLLEFIDMPSQGKFQLLRNPVYEITADVVGGKDTNGYVATDVISLVKNLILSKTKILEADIDNTSFSLLHLKYKDMPVGFYAEDPTSMTVKDTVDWLLASINCFIECRRDGRLYVQEFFEEGFLEKNSDLTYDYKFTEDDFGADIQLEEVIPAMVTVAFAWKKNWSPLTSFSQYIEEEELNTKIMLEQPHSIITIRNENIAQTVLEEDPQDEITPYESLLLVKEDAQIIANQRAVYYSKDRYVISMPFYKIGLMLNIGNVILLETVRYRLNEYPVVVINIEDPIMAGKGNIKVLK